MISEENLAKLSIQVGGEKLNTSVFSVVGDSEE